MTAAAQNMLTMKLGQEVAGIVIANPWITWLKVCYFYVTLALLHLLAVLHLCHTSITWLKVCSLTARHPLGRS
jgi:hypothetical protein